jgi:hypothetical protein
MKIRIIEETKCNKSIYKIQRKFLFWWINILEDFDTDLTFTTLDEARSYVCENCSKPLIKIIEKL